ncbi:hypothetical protein [Candidatus Villigracilis saccharophilus]|nr:hypothetical protein [Anaerolineales bacterium]
MEPSSPRLFSEKRLIDAAVFEGVSVEDEVFGIRLKGDEWLSDGINYKSV